MAQQHALMWQTTLRDSLTPLWLLEWPLERRMRRRVLVAADTSDSCEDQRSALTSLSRMLARVMSDGDSMALWVIGCAEKRAEIVMRRASDRDLLVQTFDRALVKVRGGTWLRPTLDAMAREAAASDARHDACFGLVASDGEIFDVEAMPDVPTTGFVRLGDRESRQLAIVRQRFTEVAATDTSLGRFLTAPPLAVSLDPGWQGMCARKFSAAGALVDGEPFAVEAGESMLRVAMVGGERPRPVVEYRTSNAAWHEIDCTCAALPPDRPPHLQRVIVALDGGSDPLQAVGWSAAALNDLAAGRPLTCPRCAHAVPEPRRSLYCRRCGALALSDRGLMRSEVLDLIDGRVVVRFPFVGNSVQNSGTACEWETGDDACGVLEREETRWMVVNAIK